MTIEKHPTQTFYELVERSAHRVMRHRERYVKAFIAATGLHPTECVLMERINTDGPNVFSVEPAPREADEYARLRSENLELRNALELAKTELALHERPSSRG